MEDKKAAPNDVVVQISGAEDSTFMFSPQPSRTGSPQKGFQGSNFELTELRVAAGSASPEITATTAGKPPRIPGELRRVSLARSAFSKPKSRFQEPTYVNEVKVAEEIPKRKSSANSPNVASPSTKAAATTPREGVRSNPITPRTPLIGTPARGEEDEEDDEEVYKTANLKVHQKSGKKLKKLVLLEWTVFVCVVGFLVACLTVDKLESKNVWSLALWKWCVLVLVVLCGRLVTEWLINILVFVIETNYLLKKKVLYFVYGLKRSVQVFIWLGLILLAWGLLFDHGVKRSKNTSKILGYVTRGLASCEIGAAIWLLKNLFVKLLATSFQSTRFFDRIKESIFHQYVLRSLSGPPLVEMAGRKFGKETSSGRLSFKNLPKAKNDRKEGPKEEVIDVEKLSKMKQDKISAWTMKGLINVISGSGLSTISHTLDDINDEEVEQRDIEITSEFEAQAAAYDIFLNVAKRGSKYIEEDDLCRFLKKDEVELVFPLFEGGAESRKIKKKPLKNWLVNVYNERKSLAHSLTDTKTAIEELNKLGSAVVLVVILIVWLLLMGFLTTNILVFISSQLLLVVFVFGNTAKTVFEAIIFVFVMHPFDVGDRCVVDGVQLIVEEMNILTTIFLKPDNEKIYYPNSVLATKPISNFYRSPEMGDAVEFAVDVSTTIDTIASMKARIKTYLESKPQHWRPAHSVAVKEIEDVNKMTMALYISHTINFQNYGDKTSRRTDLILELKKIFEELNIKYHLLPQEIYLTKVGSATTELPPSWR
ncbi:putative mechanosensitive ion channel MscS [Rosa chinensis]|uniref:Mechanosensitive ion channel protein n=1 Tax=Rosa chinensis TaxID=74649 RepID=A0A2P6RKJ2_ROSCH|nr:mechanosensitive ion channel protein 10 [Rosa chinensis]XP_040369745.1 mechanosensitive ion channel protein 10 [Rosa chinensis]PRQ46935.1 putative mechanosensitive ion channel MscS [Rosa chinensis]